MRPVGMQDRLAKQAPADQLSQNGKWSTVYKADVEVSYRLVGRKNHFRSYQLGFTLGQDIDVSYK